MITLGFILFLFYVMLVFILLVICSLALPKYCNERNFSVSHIYSFFYIANLIFTIFLFGLAPWKALLLNFSLLISSHYLSLKLKVFIITGQPCSGKTWIGDYLSKRFKCKIIDGDEVYYKILKNSECFNVLKARLKEKITDNLGALDKQKLRYLLINDEKMFQIITNMIRLRVLLSFILVIIKEKFLNNRNYVFIESSYFLKFPILNLFIYPIFGVYTNNKAVLVRRIMETFSIDKTESESFYLKNFSPEELQLRCDFCFVNDTTLDVVNKQIDKLMSLLKIC